MCTHEVKQQGKREKREGKKRNEAEKEEGSRVSSRLRRYGDRGKRKKHRFLSRRGVYMGIQIATLITISE